MSTSRPISRLRRQLANELARERTRSGLTTQALADQTSMSQAKVSRSERALALPRVPEVGEWLRATGATDDVRERILALAEGAHGASVSWVAELAATPDQHLESIAAANEEACTSLSVYQQAIVPGLLQTAPYARSLLARVAPDEDQGKALSARVRRQDLLYDAERTLMFVLTERAVNWCPDVDQPDQTRAGQIDRLQQLNELQHVTVDVLEDQALPVGGFSSFNVYECDTDAASFIFLELEHGRLQLTDVDDVAMYRRRFAEIRDNAISIDRYLASTRNS